MRIIRDRVTGKAAPIEDAEEFKKKYPSGDYNYMELAEDGTATKFYPDAVEEETPEPAVEAEVEAWLEEDEDETD